jgi:hypothetical protein
MFSFFGLPIIRARSTKTEKQARSTHATGKIFSRVFQLKSAGKDGKKKPL